MIRTQVIELKYLDLKKKIIMMKTMTMMKKMIQTVMKKKKKKRMMKRILNQKKDYQVARAIIVGVFFQFKKGKTPNISNRDIIPK